MRGNQSEIVYYQKIQADIATVLGKELSPSDVNMEIYKIGLECARDKYLLNGKKEGFDSFVAAAMQENRKLDQRVSGLKEAHNLYLKLGYEKFLEWCADQEMNGEELIKEFKILRSEKKWTIKAFEFLVSLLAEEPLTTKEIREIAVKEEIIDDTPEDWQSLRLLASRKGFTNHSLGKGVWSVPIEL